MSYLVTGMADFVNGNPQVVISDLVLQGDSMAIYTVQTGIKASSKVLDLSSAGVDPSDGSYIGVGGYSGSANLADVTISVKPLHIKERYEKPTIQGKLAQLAERKGSNPDEVVFSDLLLDLKGKELNKWNEKAIWLGATDASIDGISGLPTYFNGIVKQLIADGSTLESGEAHYTFSSATDASIIATVEKMVDAIPETFIDIETRLAMSPTAFKKYRRGLFKQTGTIDLNTKDEAVSMELQVPGTNVMAFSCTGLSGSNRMVLTRPENIVIGVDLTGEEDTIEFMYHELIRAYELFAVWKLGVKVIRAHEAVINKA